MSEIITISLEYMRTELGQLNYLYLDQLVCALYIFCLWGKEPL